MAWRLVNGRTSEKISSNWRLEIRIDTLRSLVVEHTTISFCHIRHDSNKVANMLANVGMEEGIGYRRCTLEDF